MKTNSTHRAAKALFLLGLTVVNVLGAGAQTMTEWDNPAVFQLNRERAHAFALPQESVAPRGKSDWSESPYVMTLNGTWKFHWAPNPDEAPDPLAFPKSEKKIVNSKSSNGEWSDIEARRVSQELQTIINISYETVFSNSISNAFFAGLGHSTSCTQPRP